MLQIMYVTITNLDEVKSLLYLGPTYIVVQT